MEQLYLFYKIQKNNYILCKAFLVIPPYSLHCTKTHLLAKLSYCIFFSPILFNPFHCLWPLPIRWFHGHVTLFLLGNQGPNPSGQGQLMSHLEQWSRTLKLSEPSPMLWCVVSIILLEGKVDLITSESLCLAYHDFLNSFFHQCNPHSWCLCFLKATVWTMARKTASLLTTSLAPLLKVTSW